MPRWRPWGCEESNDEKQSQRLDDPQLVTIEDDAWIIEAVHLMKERNVRRLLVMHDGRLAGIVTDRMLKDYSPGKATTLDISSDLSQRGPCRLSRKATA